MADAAELPHALSVTVPFPTERLAEVIYNTLRVDKEPGMNTAKEYRLNGARVTLELRASQLKHLRVAASTVLDHMLLAAETVEQFDS